MESKYICDPQQCTGCMACYNSCGKNAILLYTDEHGCRIPRINSDLCISCNACKKVCPSLNDSDTNLPFVCYAAQLKNSTALKDSASGGIFQALAQNILDIGGMVVGAAWVKNENGDIVGLTHKIVSNTENLRQLLGSKYAQSEMGFIYREVKEKLSNGHTVLFSGTPCQIAGLNRFIPKMLKENLYTVDIVCHGVCGTNFFFEFLNKLKKDGICETFSFRDKTHGWGLESSYIIKKHNKQKKYLVPCSYLSYYHIFLKGHMYRDSCYRCKYAMSKRVSDITIGDFWGIEEECPEFLNCINCSNGVSAVLVNTEKGKALINKMGNAILKEVSYDKIIKHNEQLVRPSKVGRYRYEYTNCFKRDYKYVNRFFMRKEFNYCNFVKHILHELKTMTFFKA